MILALIQTIDNRLIVQSSYRVKIDAVRFSRGPVFRVVEMNNPGFRQKRVG